MMKAVITVIGKDGIGIIAGISTTLANAGINILDISQTLLQDLFTMIMIVDVSGVANDFSYIVQIMEEKGNELGVSVRMQREDVFTSMHRI